MNNKGFAITTILYGMLLLFLLLIVSLLGILSTYRSRLEKLQEGENGARDIIYGRYKGENVEPKISLSQVSSGTYKVSLTSLGFKEGTYRIKYGRVSGEVTGCLSLINTFDANIHKNDRVFEANLKDNDASSFPFYVCVADGLTDIYGNVLSEEKTIVKID